jgi:hypothetical protein
MFYIIGVSHKVQSKPIGVAETEDQRRYRLCLEQAIGLYQPAVVAEEFSEYALHNAGQESGAAHEPLTKAIATAAGIEHRFCDPDKNTRDNIGYLESITISFNLFMTSGRNLSASELSSRADAIETAKYWPVREQFWLDQLCDVRDRPVIFVCGDAHIEGFGALLEKNGIASLIVERHIGVTPDDDQRLAERTAYIKSHSDVLNAYEHPSNDPDQ